MTKDVVQAMWANVRKRFMDKVQGIEEAELPYKLEAMSIGQLLYHTGQVEYLFADWYLGQQVTEIPKVDHANKEALIAFLQQSDAFLQQAMEALSEEQWHEVVPSKMGDCTPIEVIGRLIYHAGMHAGQISDIQKHYA